MSALEAEIRKLYATEDPDPLRVLSLVGELLALLERGEVRAAEQVDGAWRSNAFVKEGILLGFRVGTIETHDHGPFRFSDKDTFPVQRLAPEKGVRVVPGGTSVRRGAFVGSGVIIMPPSYVNIGAFVGDRTMVDSHVLVGSCAQIGKGVHLSAGTQIGGVLEPPSALPVIVEDGVFIGGNCGVFDGVIVGRGAVLGAGTILTGSTPIFDATTGETVRRTEGAPIRVPERAVVVPGTRARNGYALSTPILVKYRDAKTDAATALEEALR